MEEIWKEVLDDEVQMLSFAGEKLGKIEPHRHIGIIAQWAIDNWVKLTISNFQFSMDELNHIGI